VSLADKNRYLLAAPAVAEGLRDCSARGADRPWLSTGGGLLEQARPLLWITRQRFLPQPRRLMRSECKRVLRQTINQRPGNPGAGLPRRRRVMC